MRMLRVHPVSAAVNEGDRDCNGQVSVFFVKFQIPLRIDTLQRQQSLAQRPPRPSTRLENEAERVLAAARSGSDLVQVRGD